MPAFKHRLLLTFSSELVDGCPLYVASNSSPLPWARKEPAGHAFHEASRRKFGYGEKCQEVETPAQERKEKTESPSVDSYHFKGKKKSSPEGDQQDHYALLGLSHLRFLATEEQIRKSYRDVALKHHPDKQAALLLLEETERAREEKKEEIDRYFKSIQEAYEILIDPIKRRLYDSIDEFDDEVPSDCSQEDFFKVFGPVFLRNGRWSLSQPVPSLGDDVTSIADVDTFYDFWWSFKSWREFPHADEFDLEQAESREHKRWMERQNVKLREKAKREENGRIRTLVENSYKRDPRILRRKEEEKAEKLRKKQAKVLAKQEKESQAARLVEEERLRKVEEDRKVAEVAAAQKKTREKEKKLLRKERQRLRAAAAAVACMEEFCIGDDAIECLCTSLEMADMTQLCEKLENSKDCEGKADVLRSALKGSEYDISFPQVPYAPSMKILEQAHGTLGRKAITEVEYGSNASSRHPENGAANGYKDSADLTVQAKKMSIALNGDEKREKPWSKEEVDLLRRAIGKYPKGTSQRWEVVSNYLGTGRPVDEILRAIKTVLLKKPDSSKAFDSFLSKRKPAIDIASPLSTRDDPVVRASETSTVSHVVSDGFVGATGFDRKGKTGGLTSLESGPSVERGVPGFQPENNVIATSHANGNSSCVDQEMWSEMQELALVKALKTFPKDSSQRWERIAAAVPGKMKSQCFKKFAELRENFRSKKGID